MTHPVHVRDICAVMQDEIRRNKWIERNCQLKKTVKRKLINLNEDITLADVINSCSLQTMKCTADQKNNICMTLMLCTSCPHTDIYRNISYGGYTSAVLHKLVWHALLWRHTRPRRPLLRKLCRPSSSVKRRPSQVMSTWFDRRRSPSH